MKKIVIILIVLLVVIFGILAVVVSQAGSILESYKPELEQMASDSLGAKVTLGDLKVTIFPSARAVVDSATVSNPDNEEERIHIKRVELDLELMPLLSGEVSISTLRLVEPSIELSIEEAGFFVAGLPRETEDGASAGEAALGIPTEEIAQEMPITVKLESFVIEDASVNIVDMIAETEYAMDKLNMNASVTFADNQARFTKVKGDGVFRDTIEFEYTGDGLSYGLEDGVMGLEKVTATTMGSTILVNGELSPDDATKEITITSEGVDLVGLDPALMMYAPTAKEFGIHGTVKPDLVFALTPTGYRTSGTVTVSSFGARIEDLIGVDGIAGVYQMEVDELKQLITSEKLAGTLNGAPFSVKMTAALDETTGKLKPFDVEAFGGTILMTTALVKNDPTFPFESSLQATGLKVEELIPAFAPDMPFAITGTVEKLGGNISSVLTDDLMPSLTGNAEGLLVDGLIHDLNLGEQILASVKGLPFLVGALSDAVPAELNTFLENKDTVLSEISGTFTIKDEKAHSNDMKIVSDFFTLNAQGTIGFDTRLDLDSTIHFSPEFSAELVDEVKELEFLLDGQGRLTFPVKITGIAPELTTVPDTSEMVKGAVKKTVIKEVNKLIGDLFN